MRCIVHTASVVMVVVIPAASIVSNEIKVTQFKNDPNYNDIETLRTAGKIDLSLFGCIMVELLLAACIFIYLSRKYEIKFQIK